MTDDLVPNDSSYYMPKEPVEQVQERSIERSVVIAGRELLAEIIERFDKRIEFYSSIDSIDVDLDKTPEAHMRAVYAQQMVKQNLMEERSYLQTLHDEYVPKD